MSNSVKYSRRRVICPGGGGNGEWEQQEKERGSGWGRKGLRDGWEAVVEGGATRRRSEHQTKSSFNI